MGINDSGDIVGYGTNSTGQNHAFLLTPITVPEPSALTAMVALAVTAALLSRRKAAH